MPVDDKERGILVPEWRKPEPELEFTRAQRKRNLYARKDPLRVMPRDKRQPVHEKPATRRTMLRVHPDGIEMGLLTGDGGAKYLGAGGAVIVSVVAWVFFGIFYRMAASYETSGEIYWPMLIPVVVFIFLFVMGLWMIRRGFLSPADHPVLFNRKTGEVHVIPVKPLNFFKFWEKGAPGKMRNYRWEHVTARTYRRLDTPGGTIARTETVMQLLCSTPQQPNVVDEMVMLGMSGGWSDDYQVSLWEHIRRYMEEGGPPLQPGDKLRKINLDKVPEFPPEIIAAAGGPPLSEVELAKWIQVPAAP